MHTSKVVSPSTGLPWRPRFNPAILSLRFIARAGWLLLITGSFAHAGPPVLLKSFDGTMGNWSSIKEMYAGDDILYFPAEDGENAGESPSLWKTDGTPGGTQMVRNIKPYVRHYSNMAVLGNKLFFVVESPGGYQLWRSDGTATGTVKLFDSPEPDSSLAPHSLTPVATNNVYFAAYSGLHGMELWQTDADSLSATLKGDIFPGDDPYSGKKNGSFPEQLTAAGSVLFFSAKTAEAGRELWKVAPRGTVELVKDIYSGTGLAGAYSSNPQHLVYSGWEDRTLLDQIIFTARNATSGTELWLSDGTSSGTVLLADIESGFSSSTPSRLTAANGRTFFVADKTGSGPELWATKTPGVQFLGDIYPGDTFGEPFPKELTNVRGILYFVADDGVHGEELWRSNGTPEGTYMVKDLHVGTNSSSPFGLTHYNGKVYFGAWEYSQTALWVSDGTSSGTMKVADYYGITDLVFPAPTEMAVMGGSLYFAINNSLWMLSDDILGGLPFNPASRIGNWAWTPWLGWYNDVHSPWIWHGEHGWFYIMTVAASIPDFWFFDGANGWLYTGPDHFPLCFSVNLQQWIEL